MATLFRSAKIPFQNTCHIDILSDNFWKQTNGVSVGNCPFDWRNFALSKKQPILSIFLYVTNFSS